MIYYILRCSDFFIILYFLVFILLVYWMKAHNFVSEGKTSEAVNAYDVVSTLCSLLVNPCSVIELFIGLTILVEH